MTVLAVEFGATRRDRERRARELRDQGLLLREIADQAGVAISTVEAWLNDPGQSRLQARKASYATPCERCGGPTDGSRGPTHHVRVCRTCLTWTPEQALQAVRDWADRHDGGPPVQHDLFNGTIPPSVRREFGSWNGLLLAAGYRLHIDRRPETQQAIEDAIRRGEPTQDIAARHGVTPAAIGERFQTRRVRISDLRPADWHPNSPNRKLTADQVRDIRGRYATGGVTYRELGLEHGISGTGIQAVVRGETYKWVTA